MARRRYSDGFRRDVAFYLRMRHAFDMAGREIDTALYDPAGVDGVRAYHRFDSTGRLAPTRHPNILTSLIRAKASVNLHVAMWAEGCADGTFPQAECRDYLRTIQAPDWVYDATARTAAKLALKRKGIPTERGLAAP